MKSFKVKVTLLPRETLLDPQGQAVENALKRLGFKEVENVRVGKVVVVHVKADSEKEAVSRAEEMCRKLLANPITEDFEIEIKK